MPEARLFLRALLPSVVGIVRTCVEVGKDGRAMCRMDDAQRGRREKPLLLDTGWKRDTKITLGSGETGLVAYYQSLSLLCRLE